MDNRIIRILTLEREIFRLDAELNRLEQQFAKSRMMLGTIGTTGGQPPVVPPAPPPPPPTGPPPPDGGKDLPPGGGQKSCCAIWAAQAPDSFSLTDSVHPGAVTLAKSGITGLYNNSPALLDSKFPGIGYFYYLGCPDTNGTQSLLIMVMRIFDNTSLVNINSPVNIAASCTQTSFTFSIPPTPPASAYPNGGSITVG